MTWDLGTRHDRRLAQTLDALKCCNLMVDQLIIVALHQARQVVRLTIVGGQRRLSYADFFVSHFDL